MHATVVFVFCKIDLLHISVDADISIPGKYLAIQLHLLSTFW